MTLNRANDGPLSHIQTLLILLSLVPAAVAVAQTATQPPAASLECKWRTDEGRGELIQRYNDGTTAVVRLQDGFKGYTGGLVVGAQGRSGFEYLDPANQHFPSLNIWCAQDESLRDRASDEEYSFGWSQNFGRGYDGARLVYVGGRVIEASRERIVLAARNQAGSFQVEKLLLWESGSKYIIISTTICNTGSQPVSFDYWVGEDPWIGTYRTSEGDVGWYAKGIVRHEASIPPDQFIFGGFYDLGNQSAGEQEGSFSGAANFIRLSPGHGLPDRVYFANRFAHSDQEIDPERPLDNQSLSALNLGWTEVSLAATETLTLVYAMGVAITGGDGELPQAPAISDQLWHFAEDVGDWTPDPVKAHPFTAAKRALEPEPTPKPAGSGPGMPFVFFREHIRITLSDGEMVVEGDYYFRNLRDGPARAMINYPLIANDTMPFPDSIEVKGKEIFTSGNAAHWLMEFEHAGEEQKVEVIYRQRLLKPRAVYIVTSTRQWQRPLEEARFDIYYPADWPKLNTSYPMITLPEAEGQKHLRFARRNFMPEKNMVFFWKEEGGEEEEEEERDTDREQPKNE